MRPQIAGKIYHIHGFKNQYRQNVNYLQINLKFQNNFNHHPSRLLIETGTQKNNSWNFLYDCRECGGVHQPWEMAKLDDANSCIHSDQRLGKTHLAPRRKMDTQPVAYSCNNMLRHHKEK